MDSPPDCDVIPTPSETIIVPTEPGMAAFAVTQSQPDPDSQQEQTFTESQSKSEFPGADAFLMLVLKMSNASE